MVILLGNNLEKDKKNKSDNKSEIKPKSRSMTAEEKEQWDRLYQYVKTDILLYKENQSIPSQIVLRMKGLCQGKLIANNHTKNNADYTYETVLLTFKMCKSAIFQGLYGKTFNSEVNKFMYIAAIVENNINDVYLRIENAKKTKEKTKNIQLDNLSNNIAEYKKKTEDNIVSNRLENLW